MDSIEFLCHSHRCVPCFLYSCKFNILCSTSTWFFLIQQWKKVSALQEKRVYKRKKCEWALKHGACSRRINRDDKSKEIYWYIAEYHIDMPDISREIYRYIPYIGRNMINKLFFPKQTPILPSHQVSHRIDVFYLLDGSSELTRIITYYWTHRHEKLITTSFTGYFPSPSVCHKNLRFCWKLLQSIIFFSNWKN